MPPKKATKKAAGQAASANSNSAIERIDESLRQILERRAELAQQIEELDVAIWEKEDEYLKMVSTTDKRSAGAKDTHHLGSLFSGWGRGASGVLLRGDRHEDSTVTPLVGGDISRWELTGRNRAMPTRSRPQIEIKAEDGEKKAAALANNQLAGRKRNRDDPVFRLEQRLFTMTSPTAAATCERRGKLVVQ